MTTMIAEAGVNHDGKLSKALDLCDAAKWAGADVVKFQTYVPEKSILRSSSDYALLASLALSFPETFKVAQHCGEIGIEFCSTPDDLDSLKFLVEECGVSRIKLGSGSLRYRPLVEAACATGLPVLISTGMATMKEVIDSFYWAERIHPESVLMHCVSLYPCPIDLANVRGMIALKKMFPLLGVGYSDHTVGPEASLAATVLGADVIEKHFTLDKNGPGPDHGISADRDEMRFLVHAIDRIGRCLGEECKRVTDEEKAMIPRIRKDAQGLQPGL